MRTSYDLDFVWFVYTFFIKLEEKITMQSEQAFSSENKNKHKVKLWILINFERNKWT